MMAIAISLLRIRIQNSSSGRKKYFLEQEEITARLGETKLMDLIYEIFLTLFSLHSKKQFD